MDKRLNVGDEMNLMKERRLVTWNYINKKDLKKSGLGMNENKMWMADTFYFVYAIPKDFQRVP